MSITGRGHNKLDAAEVRNGSASPGCRAGSRSSVFSSILIKSAIWGAAWGVMEQVSTCGVFYRAPPDTHPGAQGERRYDPSAAHARLYRRRGLRLLDTGGEGVGEVRRWRSRHLRKLRRDLPRVHAMGWEIAFTRLCCGDSLRCGGGQSIHTLDPYVKMNTKLKAQIALFPSSKNVLVLKCTKEQN